MSGNLFMKQGGGWLVAHAGIVKNIGDLIGADYIATLLENQGQDISVTDLRVDHRNGTAPLTVSAPAIDEGLNVNRGLGDAGELIDEKTKRDCKQHLDKLREELEDANELGNKEKAAKIEDEIDTIKKHLTSAIGRGGRKRKAADSSKRERDAVSKSIRDCIKHISKYHTPLAKHLEESITFGSHCRYKPLQQTEWSIHK